jgi:hypothetical protein
LLTATQLLITLQDKTILLGRCSGSLGHWRINLPTCQLPSSPTSTPTIQTFANAITPSGQIADQVALYHAAMFSPVLSTWCDAIDAGHLTTWPALTSAQVRRHFPVSIPMNLGHLDQTRTNIQSTKPTCAPPMHDQADTKPTQIPERTNAVLWIYILQLAKYSLTKQVVGLPPHQ